MSNSNRQTDLNSAAHTYFNNPSKDNLNNLVDAGMGLVYHFIRIYGTKGPNDDLKQLGAEGLLKAVKNYNPDKGASFSTYAAHCIKGEILHNIRKEASYYRPGCIMDIQSRVEKYIEEFLKSKGRMPEIDEIAKKLNLKEESVSEVMRAGTVSLDELDLSRIASADYQNFSLPLEDRITLELALKKLTDIQRKVIHMLFMQDMTQKQASEKLGINRRKISRIKQKCLYRLRMIISEE